jgi:integrase
MDVPLPSPCLRHLGPQPAWLRIEDVSRLMGHSSTRVTQDVYIHVHGDLYQRFYDATA